MLNIEIKNRENNYAVVEIDGQEKIIYRDVNNDEYVLADTDEVVFCEECGECFAEDDCDIIDIDGMVFCNEDCAIDYGFTRCADCGEWVYEDDVFTYSDTEYVTCDSCHYEHSYCDCCGEYFYYEDNVHYCEYADSYYCDNCDDGPKSLGCYHESREYGYEIHTLEGEINPRTYGVELEVEGDSCDWGCCVDKSVYFCRDLFGKFIRHEEDGSLEYGFENITEPASLKYFLKQKEDMAKYFNVLLANGFEGDDSPNGGFHIHIGRTGFKDQYSALVNMHYLFDKYWDKIIAFSGRRESEINQWAKPYEGGERKYWNGEKWEFQATIEEMVEDNLRDKSYPLRRYHAINLTNDETVEIRIFKSTLNIDRFYSILQFVDNLCEICDNTRVADIGKITWEDITKDVLPAIENEEVE